MPHTVRLHRALTTKPEKVYRAFIEADALAKWMPPNGFTCTVNHMEAKVGGTFKASFRNFTTGHSNSFSGKYLEVVPNERLRLSGLVILHVIAAFYHQFVRRGGPVPADVFRATCVRTLGSGGIILPK